MKTKHPLAGTDGVRRRGTAGVVLALLLAGCTSAAALGSVGFLLWPRWPGAVEAGIPALPISVGNVLFNVPPAAIRVPVQRRAGPQPRLDLAFLWPELTPPHPDAKPALTEGPKPVSQLFLSIAAPQGALPLQERLRTIYPRYTAAAFDGPEGLIGVAFREGTPYQGEDLFYDAESPEHFLVRCTRASGPTDGTCLLERHVGEAELTLRFPRDWLADWQKLAADIDRLIGGLRPAG
jgi:hypothetical protein